MKMIEHFLPHRPPFLMVESITGYIGGDRPILNAERPICSSETVFFSADPPFYWPSVYIIEGLAQCCILLTLIWACERKIEANALSTENVSDLMTNTGGVDGDYTMDHFFELLTDKTVDDLSRKGMLASVDVEIVGNVQAGKLLQYRVKLKRVFGRFVSFAVQAFVEDKVIAHGTMVGAQLENIV